MATCPNQRCPESPCTLSASWAAEGGGDLLPGCPTSQAPRGSAQQGVWGILVSASGVCGVLAGSPAVWASWAAGLILPRRQSQASSSYESHIVWPSPGWGGGSLGPWRVGGGASSYGLGLYPSRWPTLSQQVKSLFSLLGLRMGHSRQQFLQGGSGGENRGKG